MSKQKRRAAAVGIAAGVLGLGVAPFAANGQEAPEASAEGTAAEVEPIIALSETNASAGPSGGSAEANAVRVGEEPVVGGKQDGDGTNEGEILDTGDTPLGRLWVAKHSADVKSSSGKRQSRGFASIVHASLFPEGVVTADVLQSESNATWEPTKSTGSSSSDGAVVTAGGDEGLRLVLLHSETSSENGGGSYVAGINDNTILTNEDANGECTIDASPLIKLGCLAAEGGKGSGVPGEVNEASASVLTVSALEDNLNGTVSGGRSAGGDGAVVLSAPPAEAPAAAPAPPPPAPAPAPSNNLPRTGDDPFGLGLIGVAFASLGGVLLGLARRLRVA